MIRSSFLRAVAMLVLGLALHGTPLTAQSRGLRIGDTAPTVVIEDLDGKPFDLATIVGKRPALIEFWATWCPLCRELEPTITALHRQHGDKLAIVRIVVPQNQTPERARRYVEDRGLPGQFLFDRHGDAYKAFAAYHTSYLVVLDAEGRVVHSEDGGTQDLAGAIARAVR